MSLATSESFVIETDPFSERGRAASVLYPETVRTAGLAVTVNDHIIDSERFRLRTEYSALRRLFLVHPSLSLVSFHPLDFHLRYLPSAMRARSNGSRERVTAFLAFDDSDFTTVEAVDRTVRVDTMSVVEDETVRLVRMQSQATSNHLYEHAR